MRPEIRSRYRQWLTHKLASWIDQYGVSGCVGCGRCITWCPVAIDITEEVAAIRGGTHDASDRSRIVPRLPQDDPLCPYPAVLQSVEPDAPGVATFRLEFQDRQRQERYRVQPGQFNMIYVPGVGEVPISVSSTPEEGPGIGHTIRFVGRVTRRDRQAGAGRGPRLARALWSRLADRAGPRPRRPAGGWRPRPCPLATRGQSPVGRSRPVPTFDSPLRSTPTGRCPLRLGIP